MMTHLGNGVPNEVHRHNNPIMAGIAEDGLVAGIITDGFHLPDAVIKVMIRGKGTNDNRYVSAVSTTISLVVIKVMILRGGTNDKRYHC